MKRVRRSWDFSLLGGFLHLSWTEPKTKIIVLQTSRKVAAIPASSTTFFRGFLPSFFNKLSVVEDRYLGVTGINFATVWDRYLPALQRDVCWRRMVHDGSIPSGRTTFSRASRLLLAIFQRLPYDRLQQAHRPVSDLPETLMLF